MQKVERFFLALFSFFLIHHYSMISCSMWDSPLICLMPLIRWTYHLSLRQPPHFHAQLVRNFFHRNCL
jgi:hypothetical protein